MQNNWKEIYKKIENIWDLKRELNLWESVVLPEIEQAITFTREEWQQLQNDIKGQEWFQIADIIKAKLSEKIKLSTAAQESSIRARTGMRTEALKENVDKWTNSPRIQSGQGREIPSVNNIQQQNTSEATTSTTQSSPSITEHPWEWAKEHPILATWALLWTTIIWYKAFSWMFWGESNKASWDKKDEWWDKEGFVDWILDHLWIKWDYAKWAKKLWVLWLVVAAWIWLFMWKDKIGEFLWKIPGLSWFFENKEMKAAYENFAKTVSAGGNKFEVKPDIIKKVKWEKIKDFISIKGQITATIQNGFKQWFNFVLPDVAKNLWVSADENELKQIEALQIYLDKEIKEWRLKVSDETTIEDLIKKLSGNTELVQEADKDISHKIIIWWVLWDSNLPKDWEKWGKKEEEWQWASPYPVLAARTYQLYYGVFAPWNKMSLIEKNYVMSYWPKLGGRFWKDTDFISARKSLPGLENEYRLLTEKAWSLTKDEAAGLVLLEQRIQSIKAWPKAFKDFTLLVAQWPEAFLGRVDKLWADIEASTWALNSRDKLRNWDVQKFKESYLQHEALLKEKNLIVWKLTDEIWDIDKQIATATNSSEMIRLKWIREWKVAQLATIENNVKVMTANFAKYQEQAIPLLKNEKWVKLTLAGWVKQFRWHEIDKLEHIKTSPEKQFFRLGSYKWALVLTWLWIGASAYLSMDKDGKIDGKQVWSTTKRIGAWFVPVYWTYLDWKDIIHSLKQGDMLWCAANSAAFIASLAWDVLLGVSIAGSFWLWTPAGIAAKTGTGTIRSAIKWWAAWMEATKATKAAKALKVTATAWIWAALALGVWVPIASWALNSEWKVEQWDHTKIDPKETEYLS